MPGAATYVLYAVDDKAVLQARVVRRALFAQPVSLTLLVPLVAGHWCCLLQLWSINVDDGAASPLHRLDMRSAAHGRMLRLTAVRCSMCVRGHGTSSRGCMLIRDAGRMRALCGSPSPPALLPTALNGSSPTTHRFALAARVAARRTADRAARLQDALRAVPPMVFVAGTRERDGTPEAVVLVGVCCGVHIRIRACSSLVAIARQAWNVHTATLISEMCGHIGQASPALPPCMPARLRCSPRLACRSRAWHTGRTTMALWSVCPPMEPCGCGGARVRPCKQAAHHHTRPDRCGTTTTVNARLSDPTTMVRYLRYLRSPTRRCGLLAVGGKPSAGCSADEDAD